MDLHTILVTIIACSAVLTVLLTGLGLIFKLVLSPIKENQFRFEKELKEIKVNQVRFEKELTEIKTNVALILERLPKKN